MLAVRTWRARPLGAALTIAALLTAAVGTGGAGPHRALPQYGPPPPPTPFEMCEQAVVAARPKHMPETLMAAISRVESGRLDAETGRARPWPWTINVNGIGYYFPTKEQAIASVADLEAKGTRSIDVGCMQVNLFFHPTAFATLDDAFDPGTNAAYAARFLVALYGQTGDWPLATALYHSQTQELGEDYQRRVFGQVMTPMGPPRPAPGTAAASPYAAFPPAVTAFAAFPSANLAFGAFAPASAPTAKTGGRFAMGQTTARR